MGLLSTIAKGAIKGAKKLNNELKALKSEVLELKVKYETKSDDELFRIVKGKEGIFGNKTSEKMAAAAVLKSRGYGNQEE